ncbi:MAG: tRNA pseudouridine(38-40) synthase TruA [Ignavibacteria bacterium]
MYNYKLIIEFDGLSFKGWQRQSYTDNTIQGQIESSLEKVLKEKISLKAAGRTDSGVSAFNQIANFNYHSKIQIKKFTLSLNAILPEAITIKKISNVPMDFHSRYSARRRDYIYKINTQKISLDRQYHFKIWYDLNFEKIDSFFNFLKRQKNFRSLCKNKEDKNNFICRIYELKYNRIKSKNEIIFLVSANRFLHSMVRAIIGCALDIGRGKIELKKIKEQIKSGEKIPIHYIPAKALFLKKIHY